MFWFELPFGLQDRKKGQEIVSTELLSPAPDSGSFPVQQGREDAKGLSTLENANEPEVLPVDDKPRASRKSPTSDESVTVKEEQFQGCSDKDIIQAGGRTVECPAAVQGTAV